VPTNTLATISLWLSIIGCLAFGLGEIAAPVVGFMALKQIEQTGERGRGKAIAGIVIGGIMSVIFIISLLQKIST
jgi:Domain of unknown function (DUF4190)